MHSHSANVSSEAVPFLGMQFDGDSRYQFDGASGLQGHTSRAEVL